MKTLKDVLNFMFNNDNDFPLLEEGCQKYIQAHKCLNNYLQSGIVSDNSIKEALNEIDKILYIQDNRKDNRECYWDFKKEQSELIEIVADINGCTGVCYSNSLQ